MTSSAMASAFCLETFPEEACPAALIAYEILTTLPGASKSLFYALRTGSNLHISSVEIFVGCRCGSRRLFDHAIAPLLGRVRSKIKRNAFPAPCLAACPGLCYTRWTRNGAMRCFCTTQIHHRRIQAPRTGTNITPLE
jgi:hypothetical protein